MRFGLTVAVWLASASISATALPPNLRETATRVGLEEIPDLIALIEVCGNDSDDIVDFITLYKKLFGEDLKERIGRLAFSSEKVFTRCSDFEVKRQIVFSRDVHAMVLAMRAAL